MDGFVSWDGGRVWVEWGTSGENKTITPNHTAIVWGCDGVDLSCLIHGEGKHTNAKYPTKNAFSLSLPR